MHIQNNRFSWLFLVLVPLITLVIAPPANAEGQFAAPPPPNGAAAIGSTYTIRANDTLWGIATQYGITVAQLTAANPDVNPDALRPGQTLMIPTKTSPVSNAGAAGAAATRPAMGAIYTVRPNDNLWNIATKYGLFVNDLLAANPGVDPQRLMAGQTLLIPGTYAKAVTAAATEPVKATYTVRPDDTLWDIAANFGLSLSELLAANPGVDARRLMTGQPLAIPGVTQEVLSAMLAPPPAPVADQPPVPVPVTEALPPAADEPAPPPQADQPADVQPADPPQADQPADAPQTEQPEAAPAQQPEAAPQPEPPPAAPVEINPMAQDMLNQINQKRAAGGRAALVWNPVLAAAAQAHAEDCARRNRGSHVGSDGARLTARLQRVGYPYTWQGENWANARSVDRAMQMWWNEPPGADPHVQNIMAGRATEIGIGVAKGAWGYYFIANFGSR